MGLSEARVNAKVDLANRPDCSSASTNAIGIGFGIFSGVAIARQWRRSLYGSEVFVEPVDDQLTPPTAPWIRRIQSCRPALVLFDNPNLLEEQSEARHG